MTYTHIASEVDTLRCSSSAADRSVEFLQSLPVSAKLGRMFRRFGLQSIYLLTGFPIALVAFILTVTGLSLGVGLVITLVGLPVLAATLLAARGLATAERFRLIRLMGFEPVTIRYRRAEPEAGLFRRIVTPLADPQSWFDALHAIVFFPVAVFTWIVAVVWWAVAFGGITWSLWGWMLPNDANNTDLPELLGLGSSYIGRAGFYTVAGLFCVLTLPLVIAAASRLSAAVGNVLLVAPSKHRSQVDRLTAGRVAAHAAEDSSLRRLERDIHDGPQQRLVRLAMDLGRAQQKVSGESSELASALSQAQQQAQDTLDELRALSRGIAPPILADRGLSSALAELAAGAIIPTSCLVDLGQQRLAPYAETAVYFVVAEALTNATKHSGASEISIEVARIGTSVRVSVVDNGLGGAHSSKGHGLAGLYDRVMAADGTLLIDSPTGGPTVIAAEIPCG